MDLMHFESNHSELQNADSPCVPSVGVFFNRLATPQFQIGLTGVKGGASTEPWASSSVSWTTHWAFQLPPNDPENLLIHQWDSSGKTVEHWGSR